MPELPDVENYKRDLDAKARNKTIQHVEAHRSRVLRGVSPAKLAKALTHHKLKRSRRHGKHLFAEFTGGQWMALHFGMTGRLAYFKNDNKDDPAHDRLRLDFANGYHLAYVNQRMLGSVRLIDDPDDFIAEAELGPDALDRSVDKKAFQELLAGRRGETKAALMDQRLLAGIGNVYSDEILFQARLHPKTPVEKLDRQQVSKLYGAMKRVLKMAITKGAGSDTLLDRLPRNYLLPYRKNGAKCPRCGGTVRSLKAAGRTAYYCPRCQPRD